MKIAQDGNGRRSRREVLGPATNGQEFGQQNHRHNDGEDVENDSHAADKRRSRAKTQVTKSKEAVVAVSSPTQCAVSCRMLSRERV